MRVPLIALVISLLGISGAAERASAQRAKSTGPIDSLTSVRAAERALLRADTSERRPLVVAEFRRDSLGVIIALIPAPKKDTLILGGGARVRVFRNGRAKILEFFL